jgi:hypothetical protein
MYDKVKIIIENDGEEIGNAEVLARENPDDTADYLIQNFWTLHRTAEEKLKVETNQLQDEDE